MNAHQTLEILRDCIHDEIKDYSLRGKLLNVIDSALGKIPQNQKRPGFNPQQMEGRIQRETPETQEMEMPEMQNEQQEPSGETTFGSSSTFINMDEL